MIPKPTIAQIRPKPPSMVSAKLPGAASGPQRQASAAAAHDFIGRRRLQAVLGGCDGLITSREYLIERAFLVDQRLNDRTCIVAVHEDHPARVVRNRCNDKSLEARIVATM